jgi:hypothetical protein
MTIHRTIHLGFLVGALALGACGNKRMKPEEAAAICPVINAGVKACQAEFDTAWAAESEGKDTFSATTCEGHAVGYGIEHPEWLNKLKQCAPLGVKDCKAFASCTAKVLNFK